MQALIYLFFFTLTLTFIHATETINDLEGPPLNPCSYCAVLYRDCLNVRQPLPQTKHFCANEGIA